MTIVENFIAEGHPNRPGTKLTALKGLVFHYTANANPSATALMNAKYFGRAWKKGADGKPYEANGTTPWGYGSAQVIADKDGVVLAMPPNEVAWAVGDSHLKLPSGKLGQQALAKNIFGNRQNYFTTSIEVCNNADWEAAVHNAMEWAATYLKDNNLVIDVEGSKDPQNLQALEPGKILILRHYDLTGKICPKPLVDDSAAWRTFIDDLNALIA